MKQRLLIVDDESDLREILQFNFESAGYLTDMASSAEEALKMLSDRHDLILLDIMMDGMSGFEMAEEIRINRRLRTPIIFLTALEEGTSLLKGFEKGADDYITKPFSFAEVLARVKAVLSRSHNSPSSICHKEYCYAGVSVDETRKVVILPDESELRLPPKEFGILRELISEPHKTFSRKEILRLVWDDEVCVVERTVDVHIARLRRKLGGVVDIVNRQGYGYCLK